MSKNKIIELVKKIEKKGKKLTLSFDGGGDSGFCDLKINGEKVDPDRHKPLKKEEWEFLEKELTEAFEPHFYVNSDGHYEGETGECYVDVKRKLLVKQGRSSWVEDTTKIIKLERKKHNFDFIDSVDIDPTYSDEVSFRYNGDCSLGEEERKALRYLTKKVREEAKKIEEETENYACGMISFSLDRRGKDEYSLVATFGVNEEKEEEEEIPL